MMMVLYKLYLYRTSNKEWNSFQDFLIFNDSLVNMHQLWVNESILQYLFRGVNVAV